MSANMYTHDARFAIEQAEQDAKAKHPADSAIRWAYQCGTLEAEFKALASKAQYDSQTDCVARRIAQSMVFTMDEAADLIDAIAAGIKRQHEDEHDVLIHLGDAYQSACESVNAGAGQVELPLEEAA